MNTDSKIKSLDDLRKLRDSLRSSMVLREKSENPELIVQIRVSMDTCGIAAGAKEIMAHFIESLEQKKVEALVTQTGCLGFCDADPVAEIIVPGKEPLIFGHLTNQKADEIIDNYIVKGHLTDNIRPITREAVKPE
ncbi:Ferredoxin [Bacteroidales bacterium Barb6XT]|nr:Ferredoxin [Bacteroidales bacterium Barb6XT]OAV69717.1 Ferredoxin [Bacteroidales bacterium Barb4]